jgi:hypothetical protein
MEIHAADPRAKRTALVVILASLIVGTALIILFDRARPAIGRWVFADQQQVALRARVVLSVVAVIAAGPLIGFAAYFYRLGGATVRSARFPPTGAAMIYDTPVVSGDAARTRGRILQVLAVMLVVAAIAMAGLLWTLASLQARGGQ